TQFTSPRRYRSGGLARSRPELRMSGTNQMRPASSARIHQTKWCDLDLRFAASTEPTCSAVAGKMEAKVTASGAGPLACFELLQRHGLLPTGGFRAVRFSRQTRAHFHR